MTPEELRARAYLRMMNTDFVHRVRAAVRVTQAGDSRAWTLRDERNAETAAAVALLLADPTVQAQIASEASDPPFLHDSPVKLNATPALPQPLPAKEATNADRT